MTMPRAKPVRFGRACRYWLIGGIADPAAVTGSNEKTAAAFEVTYPRMSHRIESLLAMSDLNETSLQAALAEISDMD